MRTNDKLSPSIYRFKPFFLLLIFSILAGAYQAAAQQGVSGSKVDQMSDEQIVEFYRRAQNSGLSEEQIEQAAMSQGYTISDIAKMRRRINEVRSQTQRQRSQSYADTSSGRRLPNDLSRRQLSQERYDQYRDSLLQKDTTKRLKVFGASLFENANLSFEPNLRIATPRSYIVGPDDEITIDISGAASENFQLKVSPEGTVKAPNVPPISVAGLTIEQAEQRIIARLRRAGYQGLGVPGSGINANVTLTNIRSIQVTLVGEVVRPGTYTVSSLSSAFNALYLAGGPNPETGSFRKINIIRANRVIRTIDLYDYILRADQRNNIRLQDQDVIRVADYESHIELDGEVRRPAIFEVLPGERLQAVLNFAGGFSDDAYRASITLRRNTSRERRIITISEDQLATFIPQTGDKYKVGKILDRYENRIQIAGAVMRPGDYALEPGLETVRQLIERADGLRQDAFMNRAIIVRERADMDKENISFDLGKMMQGIISDIPLMRQDSLTILSIKDLREEYYVTIEGAVNKPDTIEFAKNMSVADLIVRAGGFQEGATPTRIEVARRVREDSSGFGTARLQLYKFSIDRDLRITQFNDPNSGLPDTATFELQPFDIVYVRRSTNYEEQRQVYIYGEIRHPGNYAISSREERITNVIERAGGLLPSAYLPGAQLLREGEVIGNDFRRILNNTGAEENLLLDDGDTLFIPRRSEVITIEGGVLNPSSVSYKAGYEFDDYISEAGGFTDNARKSKAYIIYPNGRKDRTRPFLDRHSLFNDSRPKVEPGSTIVVPFKPLDTNRLSAAERIGIFSLLSTVSIALFNILLR
ncbi:SLBB domain-containing protein [Spirosoma sp. KUDC1026]|uniref:SLBB domain-containing protein n=1 Tax=Spirosoma sp. KUDC1026 TaxID=2745947 RepID=UPI00159BA2CC|nr:SLBB domain-containing protein [Spirosoma sp. KUDC1026]QKZ11929.1 SLBB domain-containing protein [Spirosoma sp. KUDC1026]